MDIRHCVCKICLSQERFAVHNNLMYRMCYKDIQMEEGTFKRKIDILSSYSTKSIFYLSITKTEIVPQVSVLTFIYGLPGLAVYV